jgi:predicted ATPase
LATAALFHLLRREEQLAQERAEAAMTLSTEQGFPFWLAYGALVRGSALAEQGQVAEGLAQRQQGLAAFQAIGTEPPSIGHLPVLATAYAKIGQVEKGLSVVGEELEIADKIGRCVNKAELHRLRGELTLAQSNVLSLESRVKEAEEYFLKALEISRRQQAKSLELRATMSLSRLWQQQGKRHEAHAMLSEVYNWFTEGFDTKDLQEAKALLEQLAEGR